MGTVGQPNPELEVLQKYSPQAGKGMGPVERDRADPRWIARGWERVGGARARVLALSSGSFC